MALPSRELNSGRVKAKPPAKPRRLWAKIVPLVAALAISGGIAAKTVFGKKGPVAEVQQEKGTPAEKRKNEQRKKKIEMLKQILKIRKELKERGMLYNGKEVLLVTVSDLERKFGNFAEEFGRDEIVDVLKEQEGQVAELEKEYMDTTEGMYIDPESGEAVGSSLEEELEIELRLKLMEAKAKQNVLREKVDEMELSESGLLGLSREELEILLSQTDGWGTYMPVDYYPWEQEYERGLILKAMHWIEWMDG